jgi:D-alanine-D-alanine ligase
MRKIKIALLAGGWGGEREVSLKTAENIFASLNKKKYKIFRYDPKIDLKKFFNGCLVKKFDLVFPALHGPFGEDGRLQGMLDLIGMPYIFSGTLASALAMDKEKAKIMAKDAGLNIAKHIILVKKEKYNLDSIIRKLSLPIFIKPIELGSSVGMSLAKTKKELKKGVKNAFEHGNKIILEKFIKGRELTVAVFSHSPRALPVIEIIPKISKWFDYKAKYKTGGTLEICPALIPKNITKKVQNFGVKIFKAIGCKDLARADFIWGTSATLSTGAKDGKIYFLEINTIPGMTATSLAPQAARAAGMEFSVFLDELILGALKNKK